MGTRSAKTANVRWQKTFGTKRTYNWKRMTSPVFTLLILFATSDTSVIEKDFWKRSTTTYEGGSYTFSFPCPTVTLYCTPETTEKRVKATAIIPTKRVIECISVSTCLVIPSGIQVWSTDFQRFSSHRAESLPGEMGSERWCESDVVRYIY